MGPSKSRAKNGSLRVTKSEQSMARIVKDRKLVKNMSLVPFDLEAFLCMMYYCRLLLWAFNGIRSSKL